MQKIEENVLENEFGELKEIRDKNGVLPSKAVYPYKKVEEDEMIDYISTPAGWSPASPGRSHGTPTQEEMNNYMFKHGIKQIKNFPNSQKRKVDLEENGQNDFEENGQNDFEENGQNDFEGEEKIVKLVSLYKRRKIGRRQMAKLKEYDIILTNEMIQLT